MQELLTNVTDIEELEMIHNARPLSDTESAFIFKVRAFYSFIESYVGDDRGIKSFALLRLRDIWIHTDTPILHMTQEEIVDTVHGLQWLLLSEIYVQTHTRTEAWFREFIDAMNLARVRVFDLIKNETDKEVLNVDKYTELAVTEEEEAERKRASEYDYDSDEETRRGKKVGMDKNIVDEFLTPPHRTNDAFVMDMDSAFRAMDAALCARWAYGDIPTHPQKIDLRPLRTRLFKEWKEIKETTVLEYRRKWIQDLLIVPSYTEVHTRWKPFDKRPTSRSVLVTKNDTLAYISVPKSIMDIVMPPAISEGPNGGVDMRMHTDAALFYISASSVHNDHVREIWLGNLDWKDSDAPRVGIGRMLATQQWIAFMPDGTRVGCSSFSAAFIVLSSQNVKTKEFIENRLELASSS